MNIIWINREEKQVVFKWIQAFLLHILVGYLWILSSSIPGESAEDVKALAIEFPFRPEEWSPVKFIVAELKYVNSG